MFSSDDNTVREISSGLAALSLDVALPHRGLTAYPV